MCGVCGGYEGGVWVCGAGRGGGEGGVPRGGAPSRGRGEGRGAPVSVPKVMAVSSYECTLVMRYVTVFCQPVPLAP